MGYFDLLKTFMFTCAKAACYLNIKTRVCMQSVCSHVERREYARLIGTRL